MKMMLLIVPSLVLLCMCSNEPTAVTVSEVTGIVEKTNQESFSLGSALVGSQIGVGHALLFGAAGAEGCTINARIGGSVIRLNRPDEFCRAIKKGASIKLKKVTTIRVHDKMVTNISYK